MSELSRQPRPPGEFFAAGHRPPSGESGIVLLTAEE